MALGSDFPRRSFSILDCSKKNSLPLVLTVQRHSGSNYVIIATDKAPQMQFINNLPFTVQCQQWVDDSGVGAVLRLPPGSSRFWQLPVMAEVFPKPCVASEPPVGHVLFWSESSKVWPPVDVLSRGAHNCGEMVVDVSDGVDCVLKVCLTADGAREAQANRPQEAVESRAISVGLSQLRLALFDGRNEALKPSFGVFLENVESKYVHGQSRMVSLSIGCLQVENFKGSDQIDFPVVLCRHLDPISEKARTFLRPSPSAADERDSSKAVLRIAVHLRRGGFVEHVDVSLSPLAVNIEDEFLEQLSILKMWSTAAGAETPKVGIDPTWRQVRLWRLPPQLASSVCSLTSPLCVGECHVNTVHCMLTVHATAKLFFSVDRAPLSLDAFHLWPCATTSEALTEAVSVHFVSTALTGLGWLLSSLEMLGAPGALMRSLSSGMRDLIQLPYEGLTRGPSSFVAGVGGGTASLLRHVSAGALTSLSRFAGSAARNLDRLSLDSEHAREQQRYRRNAGTGFRTGLHNFGLAWLGAVAGLAGHPLQPFLRQAADSEEGTKTSTLHLVGASLAGIGKGIVGAVTKPVGGAMDLIAQTGEGVLESMDLVLQPDPRLVRPNFEASQLICRCVLHCLCVDA